MRFTWTSGWTGVAAVAVIYVASAAAQQKGAPQQTTKTANSDWPLYRHDLAGTGYSPLAQITVQNANHLAQAWTYRFPADAQAAAAKGKGRGGGGPNSEATPIVVNDVMYLPAANRVVALAPNSGKEIWEYVVTGGVPSRRGVAYWPGDGTRPPHIVFTAGRRLIALNANTGKLDPGFGKEGEVDMVVPYNSVPLIFKNVVVVGANTPQGPIGAPGNARAFDARTGLKLWEFSSVAQPGEPGHDTWEGDSWKDRSGTNAWPFYFTLDEQRGLVYLPLASPASGFYGGDRKGANLYGNSVVAVDVATGKYKWHFQTIHHDLWDHDPPAPPALFDIVRGGTTIPALAITTKSGYMYILNRENGQPVFGAEERPVPKSDVPGELAFPTQPFPVKPPPIARNSFRQEDLVTPEDTTAEHAQACQDLIAKNGGANNAGPFTTWAFRPEGAPVKSSLVFPGGLGGANWGGVAWDPNTKYAFVVSQDDGALGWMEKTPEGSPIPYDRTTLDGAGPGRGNFDVRVGGLPWPCQKPPWGRLTAVNTTTGDFAWQIPLGITEGLPEGKQNTGRPALAGAIVTAGGVLFVGSTDDNRFRAIDAKTGMQLWVTKLDRRANADPITYLGKDGKQYVAIVATDALVTFSLP
jgi:quinoprotein glucose dehydrogenase